MLERARSIQLSFFIDSKESETPDIIPAIEAWEQKIREIVERHQKECLECDFGLMAPNIIKEELSSDYSDSIISIGSSLASIFFITILCLGQSLRTWKERLWVGIAGLAVTSLAFVAGLGLVCACGYTINPLTLQVLPFFAFGIGIDNVFYLCNYFVRSAGSKISQGYIKGLDLQEYKQKALVSTVTEAGYSMLTSVLQMNAVFASLLLFRMDVIFSLSILVRLIQ
jgi:predicted RND superfamily exporter protein